MVADKTVLSPAQDKAVRLLVEGWKLVDIARELEISRHTLWDWRREPAFGAAVDRYQADALRDVRLTLTRLGLTACATLEKAMDGDESAQRGVSAAREVLDRIGATFTAPAEHSDTSVTVHLATHTVGT